MQEVDGFRRPRAGGPNRFVVRAQHGCPIRDILGMLQSSRDLQLRAEERRGEFGDEFLEGVGTVTEAFAELSRESCLGAAPVTIMPTDELCRVDQTSRVRVKRIDSAIRHNQKAARKGPWVLRVATRAAWRRPTVFTTIASHSDCPCGGRLYLANIASRWRRLDYTLLFIRVGRWSRETVRFSIESIIELLTFRYAIDIVEKTTFAILQICETLMD
jgi:hypothetical protein